MKTHQKGIGLTLISAVFNGSTYLLTALLLLIVNVETMLVFWFVWAVIIFFAYFAMKGRVVMFLNVLRNRKIAVLGLINLVSAILWTYGIFYGGPTLTAFVFRFEMVFTVLIGVILLKERLSKRDIIGISLAFAGAFIMSYNATEIVLLSVMIIMLAAFFSATSIVLAKVYVKNIDHVSLATGRSVYILIGILFVSATFSKIQTPSLEVLYLTFLAGFLGAFLGFFTFYKSLSYYEVSKAIAVRSIEPFFAAILSLIILVVVPSLNQIIGGTLIIIGVIFLALKPAYMNNKKPLDN